MALKWGEDEMAAHRAWLAELKDGFENRGWYIVTDDGRHLPERNKPQQPKPTGVAPKHKGTSKGFQIIKEILENA